MTRSLILKFTGKYSGLETDYPSLSMINYWRHKKNKYIIFGTTKWKLKLYEELGEVLESRAGLMGDNGEKIGELVKKEYEEIRASLEVSTEVESNDDNFDVKYSSACDNFASNTCQNIGVGTKVEFTARVKIKKEICDKPEIESTVTFKMGSTEENDDKKITVTINPICNCDCTDTERPATDCRPEGVATEGKKIHCGVCRCRPGYSGEVCECNNNEVDTGTNQTECREVNDRDGMLCNDRGTCKCGQCVCEVSNLILTIKNLIFIWTM